ncbi:MAG: hypothetical protein JRF08_02710, partial [Deltaproteobacteria bacterium]|nr:hypothetical protein [Deltaproteobacteria bacterium]
MVRFISALFNGGVLFKPQVTKWIEKNDKEKIFKFKPNLLQRWGIKKENMELVKTALIDVVNEPRGTGRRARLDQ